jgi:cysteine-rich repeat protein
VCGDGELGADEECDDGGRVAGDGCRADCTWEVTALALGGEHSCALRGPRVRCWGRGDAGRLGHGDTVSIGDDEPAAAGGDIELGGDAVAITAGGDHSCALLSGGDVVCWGGNAGGWLGYGNTEPVGDDETPASVGPVAVGGPALAIATGRSATCALLESTELRCWGQGPLIGAGNDADLGDDETPARIDPVMLGGVASVVDVGELHTCAGGDDGLWCWGQGVFGQLGYGNTELVGDDETPAEAGTVDLGADVVALAMGDVHSCALTDAGGVRCWGQSGFGQLGYGNGAAIGDDESPATAGDVALGGEATAIATGIVSSYALLADGTIVSWGGNDSGELGRGNTTAIGDNETPASVPPVDVGGVAVALAAGQSHACALLDDGAVRCWGAGFSGRLGHGNTDAIGDDETPADVGDVPVY